MTIDELMDDDSNVRSSEKNISAKTELSGTNKRQKLSQEAVP